MKTIQLTPTWRGLLPALVEVAVNGQTVAARKLAMDELYKLADFADKYNAEQLQACMAGLSMSDLHT